MCGIVGQFGPAACDRDRLEHMMGMVTHRGPDESGWLVADGLAFGHLRLSIVDLRHGQQPMSTADGRYWITFNGEIFNHVELREELEREGQAFRTHCDTEVLLNAYRAWGLACLDRFNGQWAFALWDRLENSLFLARDRFGVRPLFYTVLGDGETLVFASEMKAILADPRVPRELDPEALRDVFTSWACEGDRTPLGAIRQLPAGSWMSVKGRRREVRKWWDIDYSPDLIDRDRSDASWREELRATLDEACRLRLRADVVVGTYLSGGLDSSVISWISKTNHQPNLQTFSIAFADAGYDESGFQDLVARSIGTEHHRLTVGRDLIATSFRDTIWHTETPMHRTAPVPLKALSGLVRGAGLKVVLSGEGADEVLGGYDQFKENKIRRFWAQSPASPWRRRLLERLEANVPRSGPRTRAFWYAFYQEGLGDTDRPGYSHHPRWRNGGSLVPLIADETVSSRRADEWIARVESTAPRGFERWDPLSQAQYWEIRQFLAGYLLSSQGDRVAMANGIEGRYPFLDINLFELSRRMPPAQKLRVLREKDVLKRAFWSDLPRPIVERKKYPYRAPDALALYRGAHREPLVESLSPEGVRRRGLFHVEAIRKLMDRVNRTEDPAARDNMALVLTYSTHLFYDLFVEAPMRPSALPPLRTAVDLGRVSPTVEHIA